MAEDNIERNQKVVSVAYSVQFNDALSAWKKKDRSFFLRLVEHTDKIIQNPFFGKPLRYSHMFWYMNITMACCALLILTTMIKFIKSINKRT